jgi:tetratricopeptide (TPR) repeat protein
LNNVCIFAVRYPVGKISQPAPKSKALTRQNHQTGELLGCQCCCPLSRSSEIQTPHLSLSAAATGGLLFFLCHPQRGGQNGKAESLNSRDDYSLIQLAWLLATCADPSVRDGRTAVEAAKKACELAGWKNDSYIDALAAAWAEAGDFEQAVKYEKQAIEMAKTQEQDVTAFQQRLALFEKRVPFHETPKTPEKPD